MAKTTPAPEPPAEESVGIAVIAGREIKMKRLEADQLIAVDMMARRLQRMAGSRDADGKFPQAEWERFLAGTRRLLDWVEDQFYDLDDLEWFEDAMLRKEVGLGDLGPLLEAMGAPQAEPAPKGTPRKARRAQ